MIVRQIFFSLLLFIFKANLPLKILDSDNILLRNYAKIYKSVIKSKRKIKLISVVVQQGFGKFPIDN
jgi:hypothetical protein